MPNPTLVQSVAGPGGATNNSYASMVVQLPNPAQAGNCIVVCGQYGVNAGITVTVTDSASQGYSIAKTGTSGDTNQTLFIAYFPNTTAGVSSVTINYTGTNASFVSSWVGEFNNIAATSPVDVTTSNQGSGTSVTAGSFTPTVSGDLLIMVAEQDSSGALTSWTAGSQTNITWALTQNDIGFGDQVDEMVQWGVYSANTAINPTATMAPTGSWNAIAVAFKQSASAQGSPAPSSGIYVYNNIHYNLVTGATSTVIGAPISAACNLGVLALISTVTGDLTGIVDSNGNAWTKIGQVNFGGSGFVQYWYTANATFAPSAHLTLTFGALSAESECILYGLSGAATAPLDTGFGTAGFASTTGTQSVSGNLTTVSGTPSTSNGVIFGMIGINSNQINGLTSGIFDAVWSVDEAIQSELDENNGRGHFYNPTTSAFTFVWTVSAAVSTWAAAATAFKAPPAIVPIFEDDSHNISGSVIYMPLPVDPVISVW